MTKYKCYCKANIGCDNKKKFIWKRNNTRKFWYNSSFYTQTWMQLLIIVISFVCEFKISNYYYENKLDKKIKLESKINIFRIISICILIIFNLIILFFLYCYEKKEILNLTSRAYTYRLIIYSVLYIINIFNCLFNIFFFLFLYLGDDDKNPSLYFFLYFITYGLEFLLLLINYVCFLLDYFTTLSSNNYLSNTPTDLININNNDVNQNTFVNQGNVVLHSNRNRFLSTNFNNSRVINNNTSSSFAGTNIYNTLTLNNIRIQRRNIPNRQNYITINTENNFIKKFQSVCTQETYSPKKFKDEIVCGICLEKFKEKEDILILPCKHKFHNQCIIKWMGISKFCPFDKQDISLYFESKKN
jgi:hypothetical protein